MRKLNRPTDQRLAVIRSLATNLLWYGKIETTLEKAKEVRTYAEKLLTKAINTYDDVVKTTKTTTDEKGVRVNKEVINDGAKKQEVRADKESKADYVKRTEDIKHPLIEKIFNVYAPKYASRKETLGIGGGYTRIIKLGTRNGDNAEMAIIELV